MQVTVTMSDDDMENLTTLSLSCGDSMLEEFSRPQESILDMLRRVLCAYGFRFDNDERLALYNESTQEVRY